MKPMTPRARLKYLRRELRYVQTMNRKDATLLKMGIAQAKRLGAEMRAVQKQIGRKRVDQ